MLVLVQARLLLHKTDRAAHAGDGDTCVICLVGQDLDHARVDNGHSPAAVSNASSLSYTSKHEVLVNVVGHLQAIEDEYKHHRDELPEKIIEQTTD